MIDTHSHIFSEEFDLDRQEVVCSALENGVEKVILANVDYSTLLRLEQTQKEFPHFCYSAMGLHPTSVTDGYKEELEKIIDKLSTENQYVAIGEIGIDLYWDKTFLPQQIEAFQRQVEIALELNLPIIVHIRKAYREVFEALKKYGKNQPRGVFHCFSGGLQEAHHAVSLGYYLGVGGVLTYKNSTLHETIKQISPDKILLETDAPYLSPVPYRGKRNEPKYLREICSKLAEVYETDFEKIDKITTQNARQLFRL